MLRLLKALLLALAVCALSIFSTSCGSGGSAQVRVFNAIPDNGANGSIALDLWFNDNLVITALGVNAITESNPIASNGSEDGLSSSTEYTLLLGGFTDSPPTLYIIPDDNTPPAANFTKVRVIDASAVEGANPLDVYLYQVGTVPPASPQIPTLTLGSVCSASPCSGGYYPLQFTSGQPAYDLEVVRHGGPILYVFSSIAFSAGEIVTVILDDEPGGFTINPSPKVMIDLN
jgi:hypothetical protein